MLPQKTMNEKWTWSPCWVAWLLWEPSFAPASYGWSLRWVRSEGPRLWLLDQWCLIFFCSEISLILVRIFEVNHFVWLWESHPLLCFHLCFSSCPRWWGNYYAWSVQKWKKKDGSGVSKWYNSIQFCHWTLHPVFAWFLLLLSPFCLLPGCLFFHHENGLFL